jgi:cytoskeletal protein CcmA (bactofilin family)
MSSTENRWKSIGGINRTKKNYIVRTPEMTTKNNKITNVSGLVNSTMEQKSTINLSDSARIKYTDENTIYNTNIVYYPFNNLSSLSNADSIENECNNTNVTTSNFNLYLGLSDNLASSSADYSNNIYVVDDETYGSCIEFRNKSYTMYTDNALNTTNIYGDTNADNYKLSYGLSINCWVKPRSLDSSFCLFAIDTLNQDYLNTTDINTDDISKNTLYFWWPGETSGKGQILLTNNNDISVNNYHSDDVIIANDNSFGSVQENVWQMITLQIDGNKIELYVNGVKEASINNILVGTPIPDAPILINAGPLRWSETDGSYNSNITNYESDSSTGLRMLDFNVDNGAFSSTLLIDKYEAGPNNKFDFAYLISENGLHVTKDSNFTSNMNVGGVLNTHGSLNAFGLSSLYDDTYIYGDLYVEGDFIVNDDVTFSNANFYSMNISGNLVTNGTSTLEGSTTINDTLTVNDISTFNGSVYINDMLNVSGITTISSNMNVTGTTSLSTMTASGTCTINNILTVIGNTTLEKNLDVTGSTTINNSIDVSGPTSLYNTLDVSGATNINNTLMVSDNVIDISGNTTINSNLTTNSLVVTNDTSMNSNLTTNSLVVTNDTSINSNLTTNSLVVTNETSMNSNVYINGNLTVDSSVNILGNIDLSGTATLEHLTVVGDVTFDSIVLEDISSNGTVKCNSLNTDALIVTADATIEGTLNVGNLEVIDTFTITNDLSLDKINVTEIDTDKIGIGTSASSTYPLDISGDMRISNTYANTYVEGGKITLNSTATTPNVGLFATSNTKDIIIKSESTTNGKIRFYTGNSDTETMIIDKTGNVGIGGMYTPSYTLEVSGNGYYSGDLTINGDLNVTGTANINVTYDSGLTISSGDLTVSSGNITASGTVTANSFSASSDMKLKDNIMPIENSLMTIEKIQGKTFTWKNDDKKEKHYGVIAQEIETILPELVITDSNTNNKSVNYIEIIGLLIESVKELSEKVKSLEKKA